MKLVLLVALFSSLSAIAGSLTVSQPQGVFVLPVQDLMNCSGTRYLNPSNIQIDDLKLQWKGQGSFVVQSMKVQFQSPDYENGTPYTCQIAGNDLAAMFENGRIVNDGETKVTQCGIRCEIPVTQKKSFVANATLMVTGIVHDFSNPAASNSSVSTSAAVKIINKVF